MSNAQITSHLYPQHLAVIMDGNGRWASQRRLPRFEGHRAGVKAVKQLIQSIHEMPQVKALTLFALSTENMRRPESEVLALLQLLESTLRRELKSLHAQNIRLQFLGDVAEVSASLAAITAEAEALTAANTGLILTIACNYSGPWHIAHALSQLPVGALQQGAAAVAHNQAVLAEAMTFCPYPVDLVIRTSGEQRLSNFLLWHIGYAELYFTECLWPDFNVRALQQALHDFSQRQRRFGLTHGRDRCATQNNMEYDA